MDGKDVKEYLRVILELLKQQALRLDRQHRWLCSLNDTIASDGELGELLKEHSSCNPAHDPSIQTTDTMLLNIDLALQKLRDQA
jgi:hypothetical protein